MGYSILMMLERGTHMGVIVLMMLITLSVSMVAIILAAVAMSQASRAARAASEAGGPALSEDDRQKMSETAAKLNALDSRMDRLEGGTAETSILLEKLEAELGAAEQEVKRNAADIAEVGENLVHFTEFKSIVEETHRRISNAFSFTQDTEASDIDLPAEEESSEPREDMFDSGEDPDKPAGGYDGPAVD